jgi:hypothetical protein
MAYMNQEKKAKIQGKLKPILAKFGLKGSLSVRNHSSICLLIKSGPIDFIGNSNETCSRDQYQVAQGFKVSKETYTDVNPYHYKSHFSGIAKEALDEILPAMYSADYYDESDAMTDYFNTAYYVHVTVGCWDRPYVHN